MIDSRRNRNKWKLDKQKNSKNKNYMNDDFQFQIDQLNEVTSNILSQNAFKNIKNEDDSEESPQEEDLKTVDNSSKSKFVDDNLNIIDFNTWQEKFLKSGSNSVQNLMQQEDNTNDDHLFLEDVALTGSQKKPTLEGNNSSRKASATMKIKKKDIILKNASGK